MREAHYDNISVKFPTITDHCNMKSSFRTLILLLVSVICAQGRSNQVDDPAIASELHLFRRVSFLVEIT